MYLVCFYLFFLYAKVLTDWSQCTMGFQGFSHCKRESINQRSFLGVCYNMSVVIKINSLAVLACQILWAEASVALEAFEARGAMAAVTVFTHINFYLA